MDFSQLAAQLNLSQVAVGLLSALVLEGLKKVQAFKLSDGNRGKLRVVAGGLALAGNALALFMQGKLADPNVAGLIAQSVFSFLIAHTSYKGILQGDKPQG